MNSEDEKHDQLTTNDQFVVAATELCEQLSKAATSEQMDPSRLMRLTALGVSHCIAGIAILLEEK